MIDSKEPPFVVMNVSTSFFSVARHYGGCKIQGKEYVYIPTKDALIRKDKIGYYQKLIAAGQTFDDFVNSFKPS